MPQFPQFNHDGALSPWHDVDPSDGLLPAQFNAIIEIPLGSSNKYELDKKTGLLQPGHKILAVPLTSNDRYRIPLAEFPLKLPEDRIGPPLSFGALT